MCGITGYYGTGDPAILGRMNGTLRHRGPDGARSQTFAGGTVGLAQSRLSIIDLSPAGSQPMSNEDGTVWIAFNGEIYNFKELRAGLRQKHSFKGQSDTEAIIHLYEEIGFEVFSRIQGMFAIALYDSRADMNGGGRTSGRLILARDRMGKKPLYWSARDGTLLFGSELKALMQHPSFRKEIDPVSLNKYLMYENVPTPHTIFRGVSKLEPGTYLVWDGAKTEKHQFWKPTFLPKRGSLTEALSGLGRSLEDAVSARLVADVPVGIFLSGGLDSSAVAYYASQAHRGTVKTFSIGFEEASFDESAYARKVAAHLGTEHHEQILSVGECIGLIPQIGQMLDEPVADASIVPTYLLSKFAREHVTVALGGDGGDELFSGYDTFLAHKLSGIYGMIPRAVREHVIGRAVGSLPASFSNMSFDFRAKRFVGGYEGDPRYRDRRWFAPFDRAERERLLLPDAWKAASPEHEYDDIDRYLAEADSHDPDDELALLYQRMYMMDQVLVKVDRASMMNSLEVRAPFLDTRVVDLANHLPAGLKLHGLTRKYVLKKLMEGKLPRDIIYRPKRGFSMPVAEWIRGELKPLVLDLLGPGSLSRIGLFEPRAVERILEQHFAGKRDNRKQIWTLLVYAMWHRRWME